MVIGSTRLIIVAAAGTSTPRFAYVTNLSDDTLSIYSVNPSTGQLRPHGYVLTGSHPDAVSLDPSGKFAYIGYCRDNSVILRGRNFNSPRRFACPAFVVLVLRMWDHFSSRPRKGNSPGISLYLIRLRR